jgi:hypothetical protein
MARSRKQDALDVDDLTAEGLELLNRIAALYEKAANVANGHLEDLGVSTIDLTRRRGLVLSGVEALNNRDATAELSVNLLTADQAFGLAVATLWHINGLEKLAKKEMLQLGDIPDETTENVAHTKHLSSILQGVMRLPLTTASAESRNAHAASEAAKALAEIPGAENASIRVGDGEWIPLSKDRVDQAAQELRAAIEKGIQGGEDIAYRQTEARDA